MKEVKPLAGYCQANNENCPRYRAEPEECTFVTNYEIGVQCLENLSMIMLALRLRGPLGSVELGECGLRTEALLDRVQASNEPQGENGQ